MISVGATNGCLTEVFLGYIKANQKKTNLFGVLVISVLCRFESPFHLSKADGLGKEDRSFAWKIERNEPTF